MSDGATNPKNTFNTSPLLHLLYDPLLSDPDIWPDILSDARRVDSVKRKLYQVVTSFPTTQQKDDFHLLITNEFRVTEKLLLSHDWCILKIPMKHFAFAANFLTT